MNDNPVKDADVRFSLYNYAEFYPLSEKKTDADGKAQFISGKGDLIVWASDKKYFNLAKLSAGDTIRINLDKSNDYTGTLDFNLTPPPAGSLPPSASDESILLNERRKAYEDNVRHDYVNSFLSLQRSEDICRELGVNEKYAPILVNSRGNHAVIEKFLRDTPAHLRQKAADLLEVLSEKDLHDVTLEVLEENLYLPLHLAKYGPFDTDSEVFLKYVINPRIELEKLRPFRKKIINCLTRGQIALYSESPGSIAADLNKMIEDDADYNPDELLQSPAATLERKTGDTINKSLAFVAICRTLGIPARIDQVSHKVQYADIDGTWKEVDLRSAAGRDSSKNLSGRVYIENQSNLNGRGPKYYSQFTLSRIVDGVPELLEFDDFEPLESINNRNEPVACGQYCLLSGQRLADGTVLARTEFFKILPDDEVKVPLIVRQDDAALQVIGNLDAELPYTPIEFNADGISTSDPKSILSATGRGYYALGIILPGHEPSAHALNDIAASANEIIATGRPVLILFPDEKSATKFRSEDYGTLPSSILFGIDDGSIAEALQEGLELQNPVSSDYPVFVVADTFNRIIFHRHGYTIRMGEALAKVLGAVE
ncbi:MAG: transglutaminase-like domain-containing protein [Muribaculaceae bacterium]|nr:transglutaminase-like domain-containing protein [Muribaculaceae bacterium]